MVKWYIDGKKVPLSKLFPNNYRATYYLNGKREFAYFVKKPSVTRLKTSLNKYYKGKWDRLKITRLKGGKK